MCVFKVFTDPSIHQKFGLTPFLAKHFFVSK